MLYPCHFNLSSEAVSNFLQAAEVLVLLLGAIFGIHTFRDQKQHERSLQTTQFKREINLRTYEGLAKIIRECQKQTIKLHVLVQTIPHRLKFHWDFKESLPNSAPPPERSEDFIERQSAFAATIIDTISSIEENLIVFPELETSRAMLSMQHAIAGSRYQDFFMKLSGFLPTPLPPELADKYPFGVYFRELTVVDFDELKKLSDECWHELATIEAYLEDISVSLQNILLSDIYDGRTLEHRVPSKDEDYFVLKTDPETTIKLKVVLDDYYNLTLNKRSSKS